MNFPDLFPVRFCHSVAFAAATIAALPVLANAQPGFGRVANQPWAGDVTVANRMTSKSVSDALGGRNLPVSDVRTSPLGGGRKAAAAPPRTVSRNLMPLLTAAWQEARLRIVDTAMTYLDERDVGGGFRTSRNRITLAEGGPLFIGVDGRGFTMRYVLNGNRLSTYFRTPTPLGRDFDPGFVVDFDMDVVLDVELRGNQLVAGPARIYPNVKPPAGKNITGDLAVAANDLLKLLSGTDFVGLLVREINGRNFELQSGVNQELARLNPVLQAAAAGGVIVPGFEAGRLMFTIRDARAAPVVR